MQHQPHFSREKRSGVLEEELENAVWLLKASEGLRKSSPKLSAGLAIWPWQKFALGSIGVLLAAGALAAPYQTMAVAFAFLAVPFFFVVVLRVIALRAVLAGSSGPMAAPAGSIPPPVELPVYSLLVPLYREAAVVPGLLSALARIDYPMDSLDILLIVESIDPDTRSAILAQSLEPNVRVVVVPDGQPRTKPRALNYALKFARGDYVAIYDAEDSPEPDQIIKAVRQLTEAGAKTGCVQGRLNIDNPQENWLTRQFTIEYTALFDCILPALERLGLPVPLGGTSNHFPRATLELAGCWDPYNVTEDADLGIRMARMGLKVGVLDSTTWEEAPPTLGTWMKQRTRWLKGWMQTYLVHMREPVTLWRELGAWRFFGFQVLMGGLILSALVHPWFYVLMAWEIWQGLTPFSGVSLVSAALWWIGLINLVAGYLAGIALGVVAVTRRGWTYLNWHTVFMPAYWLLISLAAYRAIYQLVRTPYLWEKTDHRARTRGAGGQP